MAEVRKKDRESEAGSEKARAETRVAIAKARQEEAKARIMELASQQLKNRSLTEEEALERVQAIITKIEVVHGGSVEFQLPTPPDESSD